MTQWAVTMALELAFGLLGMIVVAWFSRHREFRADAGSAKLGGRDKMIAALRALQRRFEPHDQQEAYEAVEAIEEAYKIVSDGGLVEVGCQGGIGRTGVVIACFAIIDGIAPDEAVQWVRDRYIMRAVETPIQDEGGLR
jgi:hypothetical protein